MEQNMNIYDALKKDHLEVLGLMDKLIALDDKDEKRFALAETIRDALIPHSRAEEALFYNSIRAVDADSGKVMHGYAEHVGAETMLRTLMMKETLKLDWKKTAISLKEALKHHIGEEESEIFAMGKKVLSEDEALKIGEAFEKMKPKIKEEGMLTTTFELVKNLMPPRLTRVTNSIHKL
jgi:hemerythrin-like domain-containing protein